MKLNNKGWGIREMLLLSGILIFFFGLAIYFIYIFYDSLSSEITMRDYNKTVSYIEKI